MNLTHSEPPNTPCASPLAAPLDGNPVPVRERRWLHRSVVVLWLVGIASVVGWVPLSILLIAWFGLSSLGFGLLAYFYAVVAFGTLLYRRQQRRLRREVAADIAAWHGVDVSRRPFVTLYATHGKRFRDHDIGYVLGDRENLRFYGDRLTFTLPKARIRKITPISFLSAGWPGLEIQWVREDRVETIDLRVRGYVSPLRAHRVLQSIRLALRYGQANLPPPPPGLPPGEQTAVPKPKPR
ncbi:MAG: hypothetical protein ACO1SV_05615 [Fimbriimonas sp.]